MHPHHLGPIKTQIWKAYVTARLANEIIVSTEITGSENKIPDFILADKDRGPVYCCPYLEFLVPGVRVMVPLITVSCSTVTGSCE